KGECDGSNPPRCSQAGLDPYRIADLTASISDISLGVGGALLVSGIIVWATAPSPKTAEKNALHVNPWVGPGTMGTLLSGEF
ncbi:MAG TPA: hypothetical protein PK156_36430, partial [Polyangium sp.]|nr:hypothetical protein [Polyangium sp.]